MDRWAESAGTSPTWRPSSSSIGVSVSLASRISMRSFRSSASRSRLARAARVAGLSLMVSVIVRPVAPHIDAAGTADQAVAVIAHPRVPVADLKLSELRRLFLGERQFWSQDLPVVLLVPAQGLSEREILLSRVLNKTENEY